MHRIIYSLLLSLALTLPALADPSFWSREWPRTDFSQRAEAVESWSEILSGGPGKDGIPALTDPAFGPVAQSDIPPQEPVITVDIAGETPRAYPVRYLMWHEIANDRIGETPVAVTFCPLCNSGMVFDRRIDAGTLSFGVTGKLRRSDMVMYDRETESWWQQALGEAIVGTLTGTTLTQLPSWMESLGQFRARHPDGLLMQEPEARRDYGQNPYLSYDSRSAPFFYAGDPPPHGIPPLARVLRVGDQAWPLTRLAQAGEVSEQGLTIRWQAGQASALDTAILAQGRDVGSVTVEDATGAPVPHDVIFAFVFHAFWPEGRWHID